jgi:hypothetical protein
MEIIVVTFINKSNFIDSDNKRSVILLKFYLSHYYHSYEFKKK